MTNLTEVEELKERIREREEEIARLKQCIADLEATCPVINPTSPYECQVVDELKQLNQEVSRLRREMHEIAKRLAQYEDVTGRYFLPDLDGG